MQMELTAPPYVLSLDLSPESGCNGTVVRLPDGVEGSFNHPDALLCLLEAMGGRRWYQANQDRIADLVAPWSAH